MNITVSDQQLADINGALKWIMFQRDGAGRIVGGGEWDYPLVDTRLQLLLDRLGATGLSGRRVLEPGCLDGHITVGLCGAGADVTAFDVRPSCVIKTFARCLAFDFHPRLLLFDARHMARLGTFDLLYHSGVFYHLDKPVEHFRSIAGMAPMMAFDTHTARPGEVLEVIDGYEGCWTAEFGWHDEQSGVGPRSFWLTRPALFRLFDECGFDYEPLWQADGVSGGPRGFYLLEKR